MEGRLNMEVKNMELCEREAKEIERHKEEDIIHTIVFTVGTVFLMVCLKRFLVEQWRAWVFLVLNLILLAILFMSLRPRSSANEGSKAEEVKNDDKTKTKKKKKDKKASELCEQVMEDGKDCYKEECWVSDFENDVKDEEEEEDVVVMEEVPRLSKEELNERVEAFIANFRQHLVSDARQAENYRFHRNSSMTPNGLKCLTVEA